jgi:hypothetical protein
MIKKNDFFCETKILAMRRRTTFNAQNFYIHEMNETQRWYDKTFLEVLKLNKL